MQDLMFQLEMWITTERNAPRRKILVEAYNQLGYLKKEANKPKHEVEDVLQHTDSPAIPWMGGAKQEDHL